MGGEPSTSRVKEYYRNPAAQDLWEEEAERGNAKGSKEGIGLGKSKGGVVRRTFPGRTSKRQTETWITEGGSQHP